MTGRALLTAILFGSAIAGTRPMSHAAVAQPQRPAPEGTDGAVKHRCPKPGWRCDLAGLPQLRRTMLRILRPDLLCGLGGFALGAAALLLIHPSAANPVPSTRTDILALPGATASPHRTLPSAD